MSRRLAQMSEEAIEQGGRGAAKAVEEAGFSEELKSQLERKIADATFRSEHASAFAQASLPSSTGKEIRETAAARPWTGTESVEEASLRMLNDSYKPLRGVVKSSPSIRGPPARIDTGRPSTRAHTGERLASARDKTSVYAFSKDPGLSEDERQKLREQMKQQFQPGARSLPATIQGIASLANKRIEDAIARGQFKNLPRGQEIERDYNANSPFINTTEYFMNKMIKKQDIVPPWIEKQQEVAATASKFRSRLRADWKRHVARTIASRGGDLASQMKMAEEYAFAERTHNPRPGQVSPAQTPVSAGALQESNSGEQQNNEELEDADFAALEQAFVDDGRLKDATEHASETSTQSPSAPQPTLLSSRETTVMPFRDPQWEQMERAYHSLAIENLNSLTRSYNLMAPNLARKPYYSLERELRSCFAEVAPQVADAIRDRALAPKAKSAEAFGHSPGGVLERFAMNKAGHVYDETRPQYGFREFWKDLFAKKDRR